MAVWLTGWWYRPDYIINQLNINSAISSPAHGESLPINFSTLQEPYLVKGYAYSGKQESLSFLDNHLKMQQTRQ
jgi:hypothetical protein